MENYGTIWVCIDCYSHANHGECGGCHVDEGHDEEPLSAISEHLLVVPGMARKDHAEECEPGEECDCEVNEYSKSSCDGCGSWLHGVRCAMTMFKV
jgi:hypothetical protein